MVWEVVGKKKGRNAGIKNNAKQQKKYVENMPKLEEIAPIQESQTMFEALIEKDRKKGKQADNKLSNETAANNKNKDGVSQSKKKNDKKKNQPAAKAPLLEDSFKTLNLEELKTHMDEIEARFPESPMVWLQDLATFLNRKLDVEISDPVFSAQPSGYPTSLLTPDFRELLLKILNHCSLPTLELFFEFCLLSMIHFTVKGLNTVGFRLCLQCLAQENPSVVVANIPKILDNQSSYQNRQNVCLSILWAAGQAGNKSLPMGIKVWIDVMFPILGTRAYSKFVVEYLEKLLSYHNSTKFDKCILSVKDIFPILDFVHSSSALPANLQKQLLLLYPTLKAMSYGPELCSVLRNFFPSYLRRLEPNCSPAMKKELLSSLVECLAVDKLSYSVWRQLYTKHLVQSSILISHLHKEWDNLPPTFPRKLLCETLSTFQVTNEDLKAQGRATQDIEDCVTACNAVRSKMTAQRFPWIKLLFFLTVLVSALLAYDVNQNGSFKSSKTGQLMRDAGLMAICDQAWGKITIYTGKAYRWLEVNVPVFSSWMYQTFGPYLQLFWDKLITLSLYLWNSTEGIRAWSNTNIPPVLQVVSNNLPSYARTVSQWMEGIIWYIAGVLHSVLKFAEHYSSITIAWIHKHVLTGTLSPENLQKYAGDAVEAFQHYTLTTYNWISKYFTTVTGK